MSETDYLTEITNLRNRVVELELRVKELEREISIIYEEEMGEDL